MNKNIWVRSFKYGIISSVACFLSLMIHEEIDHDLPLKALTFFLIVIVSMIILNKRTKIRSYLKTLVPAFIIPLVSFSSLKFYFFSVDPRGDLSEALLVILGLTFGLFCVGAVIGLFFRKNKAEPTT